MTKRIFSVVLAIMLVAVSLCALFGCSEETADTGKPISSAKTAEQSQKKEPVEEEGIKNIIFMIPDGAGYSTYDFANDVKVAGGFSEAKFPNKTPTDKNPMTLRSYHVGSAITLNYHESLTDSAAAGTALATGVKTINGQIGIDHRKMPRATILEAAQSKGKATGLVATYEWMHATPAAFSAHVAERGDYENIYQQIENQGIDVVLGSGYGAVSSYATIQNAIDRGYTVIENREDLKKVKAGDRLWGNATNNSSPYDINLTASQPTLAEMTKAAITALSGDKDGFFLMVEGSKVDTGGHANDALVSTSEYLAFDEAFKVAVEFAKGRKDTIVIATPDHDTGAMMYAEIEDLASAVAIVRGGSDTDAVQWATTNHSTQNVGVWMYAPEGTQLVAGLSPVAGDTPENRRDFVVQNTSFAPYLASLIGVNLDELTDELFVDVTNIGRYSAGAGKFSFNSSDKYVYKNQSQYFKDGKQISLDGKVAFELDGRFFVPSEMVDKADWDFVSEEGSGEIPGSGTKDDPYIIDEAWDFIEFTGNLVKGETYEGKYFLQTKDIDLSKSSDYSGVGMKQNFAGVYNGGGHSIKVNLNVKNDETVFPKITGTVMNVVTKGNIKSEGATNWSYSAGIARTLADGGKLVNCVSYMDIDGMSCAGLVGSNNASVINCFFGGTLKSTNKSMAVSVTTYNGIFDNCYYSDACLAEQEGEGIVKTASSEYGAAANTLDESRNEIASAEGISVDELARWRCNKETGMPELYFPEPVVTGVAVNPGSVSVKKGDGVQLLAEVSGENGPSDEVVWSIEALGKSENTVILEDGFLYVAADETVEVFTVMAKSAVDGSISGICEVTVLDEIVTESDGTRARPYLIENEEHFKAFTDAVNGGKNLHGLYFRQTSDLDMTAVPGYNGMPSSSGFSGVYDGNGFEIKLNINSEDDNSLFGSNRGIIMNVFASGKVKGATIPAGICRAVRDKGAVVNCISACDVESGNEASGIVRSNYHVVANCVFEGALSGSVHNPVCVVQPSGTAKHNIVKGDEHYATSGMTVVTSEEYVSNDTVSMLNNNIEKAAKLAGVPAGALKKWTLDANNGPRFVK